MPSVARPGARVAPRRDHVWADGELQAVAQVAAGSVPVSQGRVAGLASPHRKEEAAPRARVRSLQVADTRVPVSADTSAASESYDRGRWWVRCNGTVG